MHFCVKITLIFVPKEKIIFINYLLAQIFYYRIVLTFFVDESDSPFWRCFCILIAINYCTITPTIAANAAPLHFRNPLKIYFLKLYIIISYNIYFATFLRY